MSRRIGRLTRVAAAGAAVMGIAVLGVRAPGHTDAAGAVASSGPSARRRRRDSRGERPPHASRARVVALACQVRSRRPRPRVTAPRSAWSDVAERLPSAREAAGAAIRRVPSRTPLRRALRSGSNSAAGLDRGRDPNLRLRAHQVQLAGLSTPLSSSGAPGLGGHPGAVSPAEVSPRRSPTTRRRLRRGHRGGSPIQVRGSPRRRARG